MLMHMSLTIIKKTKKKNKDSLAWPDRYFSAGAYRLEIISARAEKGLVQFV